MKRVLSSILLVATMVFTTGCGNLSPRDNFSPKQQQELDNRDGRINGQLDTLANSVKAEILKLQQNDEIHNSTLDKVQKGMLNLQSNNQNSGIQILSGPGGLVFALIAVIAAFLLAWHYRKESQLNEKTSEILAGKIVERKDPKLEDEVFKAALFSDVEAKVYNLIVKHRNHS